MRDMRWRERVYDAASINKNELLLAGLRRLRALEYPFVCEKCGSDIRVIAIIQDHAEIKKILQHLVKQGRAPPGVDPASLN